MLCIPKFSQAELIIVQ